VAGKEWIQVVSYCDMINPDNMCWQVRTYCYNGYDNNGEQIMVIQDHPESIGTVNEASCPGTTEVYKYKREPVTKR
jgi:hypothetical protein